MAEETIQALSRIVVDRGVALSYPNGMTLLDPELSRGGPPEYDLSVLKPWIHHNQRENKSCGGLVIYRHLESADILPRCLGLPDGLAIMGKGVVVFRKFFGENDALPLWKSVVRHTSGALYVPCIFVEGNKVVVGWHSLNSRFYSGDITFTFPAENNILRRFSVRVA